MKKLLFTLGFAAVVSVASADLMIFAWTSGENHVAYQSKGFEYVYLTITEKAAVGAPESGTAPYAAYNDYGWVKTDATSTSAPGDGEPAFAWISDDTFAKSIENYYFNLIVMGGDYNGYVRQIAGETLSKYMVSAAGGENPAQVFNVSSYGFMIPEPTSGLMLLLGLAALGLKRKVA